MDYGWANLPKRVVNDSAASRNSVVEIALSFSLSIGTSVKDLLRVSRNVPPGGYEAAAIFAVLVQLIRKWKGIIFLVGGVYEILVLTSSVLSVWFEDGRDEGYPCQCSRYHTSPGTRVLD